MSINPTQAASAYAAAVGQIAKSSEGAKEGANPLGAGQGDFGTVLKESLEGAMGAGNNADTAIVSQITGKADVVDVVSAVAEAEIAMKTLVSVRDRMISAYQDILKMPI